MVRSEYKQHTLGGLGVRFHTAGKEGKRKSGYTLSAGEASDEERARRRHSPVVAACRERERERERKGDEREGTSCSIRRALGGPRPTRSPPTHREAGVLRFFFNSARYLMFSFWKEKNI